MDSEIVDHLPIEVTEESAGQWSFRVGSVYQPYDPDEPGETPMSESRANECALIVRGRLMGV